MVHRDKLKEAAEYRNQVIQWNGMRKLLLLTHHVMLRNRYPGQFEYVEPTPEQRERAKWIKAWLLEHPEWFT